MQDILKVNYNNEHCYDIFFDTNFTALKDKIKELGFKDRRIAIVTDENVSKLYLKDVEKAISGLSNRICSIAIKPGEEYKNLDTVKDIYSFLISKHFDRHDLIIALGGGVVGDITGYVAATYLRGIAFIQIPTTLLAQTDSSIGGKTGVDFDGYKNMVGAFYMPKLVFINISVLKSLGGRLFAEGMGEILKHGLIKNQEFYFWLVENFNEIMDLDEQTIFYMLKTSCNIKREVVENDPTEKGERALLNFGHTIGHAIEKSRNFELLHGECVALGCIAAAYISMKKGLIDTGTCYEIRDMFVPFGLPISVENVDADEIVKIVKSDKKMDNGKINFILLHDIGDAFIDNSVTDEEIKEAVKEILYFENGD